MMNLAMSERNVYEDFDLESDVLYFKVGVQGLVSFHGRNYHIKKRMTAELITQLIEKSGFYQVSSNCYINLGKIKSISGGTINFGPDCSDSKQLTVNRRKQYVIQQLFMKRSSDNQLRQTP